VAVPSFRSTSGWSNAARFDILITFDSVEMPLLTPDKLAPMLRERVDRPLFIIDIAVPRDVDPASMKWMAFIFYDIDSIRSVAEQSLALRHQHVVAAEAMIAEPSETSSTPISRGINRASQTSEHPSLGENPLHASEL